MNKRAAQMAENRLKMIKAARKAFATHGYAGASMDNLTADAGLTRGALYHNFGDKRGLLAAVVDQMDSEMAEYAQAAGASQQNAWDGLLAEGAAYIEKALDPEVQRIVLLDGPSILGDPSQWPSQNRCLQSTKETLTQLIKDGIVKDVDVEATAMLINGAALNAALWVAASSNPEQYLPRAIAAFYTLATGLLSTK